MQNKNCFTGRLDTKAFTLIELLVVVLIIGILAAAALPQYQKAVWKSRNAQLKTLVKSVAEAEQRYFLANGVYAKTFGELDLDLPFSSVTNICDLGNAGNDAVVGNKDFFILLNNSYGDTPVGAVVGGWRNGPYTCTGFVYDLSSQKTRCHEWYTYTGAPGGFCSQLEKGTLLTDGENRRYELP